MSGIFVVAIEKVHAMEGRNTHFVTYLVYLLKW